MPKLTDSLLYVGNKTAIAAYLGSTEVWSVFGKYNAKHLCSNGILNQSIVTYTRVSAGMVQKQDGSWVSVPANTPRVGVDPDGTRYTLLEGQATNLVPNSEALVFTNIVENGCAWTLTKIANVGDLSSYRVKVQGTLNASSFSQADVSDWIQCATPTGSVFAKLNKGFVNLSVLSCAANYSNQQFITIPVTTELTRLSCTSPPQDKGLMRFILSGPAGTVIDTEFEFYGLQLETGSIATSPIPTYGAAATRATDVTTVQTVDTGLTDAAGCVVARVSSDGSGVWQVIWMSDFVGGTRIYTDGGVSANDSTGVVLNASVLPNGTIGTAVTSWGVGLTVRESKGAETLGSYSGDMVGSTLSIGSRVDGIYPLNGKLYELHTIPSQPDAANRAKLAGLWG